MARKDKIVTNQDERADLANPFANLQINLPPEKPAASPAPAPVESKPAPKRKRGRVVLRRETAHRGGKCVIVVDNFEPSVSMREIEDLGRKLRNVCSCGGTIRERAIELQGDHPARIRAFLENEGFRVAGVV